MSRRDPSWVVLSVNIHGEHRLLQRHNIDHFPLYIYIYIYIYHSLPGDTSHMSDKYGRTETYLAKKINELIIHNYIQAYP